MDTILLDRKSRFFPRRRESDVTGTKRNLDTLEAFNQARILPFNALHALVDPDGDYKGHRNACTRMFDAGLLHLRTFDGSRNIYETMSVSRTWCRKMPTMGRTCCGFHFLEKYGRRAYNDNNVAQDEEQLLIDLVDVGFEIAARGTDVEFHKWHNIAEHPKTPPQPKNPFEFPIGKDPFTNKEMHLVIDGLPGYFKRGKNSQLYVKEVVRTNKSKVALKKKMHSYRLVEQLIKDRYGFFTLMVLWVATSETTENTILRHIAEEFGACKWMATQTMVDHIAINANRGALKNPPPRISTPDIPVHLFNEPWKRAGQRPFSLKTLSEV